MYYNGLFDINNDGKMDMWEQDLEYHAFREFIDQPEDFDPDPDDFDLDEDESDFEDEDEEIDDLLDMDDEEYEDSPDPGFIPLNLDISLELDWGEDDEEPVQEEKMPEKKVDYKPSPEWENRTDDKKEEMLLQSFDLLKDDVEMNHEMLQKILVQLQGTNPQLTIELWRYLVKENWNEILREKEVYNNTCAYLTADAMMALTNEEEFTILEDHFIAEPVLMEAVFRYAPDLPPWSTGVWAAQVKKKCFETADVIFKLMCSNKKHDFRKTTDICNCWSSIFRSCIEDFLMADRLYYGKAFTFQQQCKDPEIYEYLNRCAEIVKDRQERARINVYLAELL